jgi:hypothetical protein
MSESSCEELDAYQLRRLAVDACVDERTVRSYLNDPTSVRAMSAFRITAALQRLGFVSKEFR